MKTIMSFIAAAAVIAGATTSAQANFDKDFWQEQQKYGENRMAITTADGGNEIFKEQLGIDVGSADGGNEFLEEQTGIKVGSADGGNEYFETQTGIKVSSADGGNEDLYLILGINVG